MVKHLRIPKCNDGLIKESASFSRAVSFCTGALMKLTATGAWVTSMQDNADQDSYASVLSPCASLTPFPDRINTTRLGLSNMYLQQAICEPYCAYMPGIKLTPMYSEKPLLMPDVLPSPEHLIEGSLCSMPGLNLRVVFMNMHLTHEDGMVMSRSASARFIYRAEVKYANISYDYYIFI